MSLLDPAKKVYFFFKYGFSVECPTPIRVAKLPHSGNQLAAWRLLKQTLACRPEQLAGDPLTTKLPLAQVL